MMNIGKRLTKLEGEDKWGVSSKPGRVEVVTYGLISAHLSGKNWP